MIRSIRHKGLKKLFELDDPSGVNAEHVGKLRDISGDPSRGSHCGPYGYARLPDSSAQRSIERFLGCHSAGQLAGDFSF